MGEYKCKRCSRKLTNPKSVWRGYGDTCYKNYLKELELEINERQMTIFHFLEGSGLVKGKYKNKPIIANVVNGVVTYFAYEHDRGKLFYPLIENGRNVEENEFEFDPI